MLVFLLLFLMLAFGAPRSLPAQDCSSAEPLVTAPLDIGQGAVVTQQVGVPTPYAAAARLQVPLGLLCTRRLHVGPVAAVSYFRGAWDVLGGGGVSYRVFPAHPGIISVPVRLGLEALAGTASRRMVTASLVIEPLRVLRLGARVQRDVELKATSFEISLGTDLRRWILRPPLPAPAPLAADPCVGLTPYYCVVTTRISVDAGWLTDPGEATAALRSRTAGQMAALERQRSLDQIDALLRAQGLARLAATIREAVESATTRARNEHIAIPDATSSATQQQYVQAVTRGLRIAMQP
jgi:hypothetical protein